MTQPTRELGSISVPVPAATPSTSPHDNFCGPLLQDACLLFRFALATGKELKPEVSDAIIAAEDVKAHGEQVEGSIKAQLVTAYSSLATALGDVTAASLRATSNDFGRVAWPWARTRVSEALIWSRKLMFWAIAFGGFIVLTTNYVAVLTTWFAKDEYTAGAMIRWHILALVLSAVVPFAYGGLGACAFLLKTAHTHIYGRTFDTNRIPEYYNRMLLGAIAGGTIELLIDHITQDGAAMQLSAAALAFVAGYNADLLFKSIERISEALLPKVGIESVRRAGAPSISAISLPALLEQLENAKSPEAIEALSGIIGKVKDKL